MILGETNIPKLFVKMESVPTFVITEISDWLHTDLIKSLFPFNCYILLL